MNPELENYYSRLSEVLAEVGQLTQGDLDYCKGLTEQEFQGRNKPKKTFAERIKEELEKQAKGE